MSVNILWSLTDGGDAIGTTIDHGNSSNGASTSDLELFVRHDGLNEITDAGLYIRAFSGTYSGSFTPTADLAELIAWADASTSAAFGGFLVNMNALTAYATGWATYDSKSPTDGFVHRTGIGDSEGNAVTIPLAAGVSSAGVIAAGSNPNVRFKVRCTVPSSEDTIGVRQWDHVIRFSFTS